ncbi:endoglucanase a precursor [Fusarium oxysporum f. sp. phaseoli]
MEYIGFSQCLQAPPSPTSTSNSVTPSQPTPIASLCDQYAYYNAGDYSFNNNLWGMNTATSGSQCSYYYGPAGRSGVAWASDWHWVGGKDTVKSYSYVNRAFKRKRISEINHLPTTVRWSYNVTDVRGNVAYDIFTHKDIDHFHSDGELAVFGGVWPITESGAPVAKVTLAGRTWNLYTGWNTAVTPPMRVYSFLPANGDLSSFSGDVIEFFQYLTKAHAFPAETQYMLMYQFGSEPFTGGPARFNVSLFEADVQ